MDVTITNTGPRVLRVIIDGDNVDDMTLEPDESGDFVTRDEGTLELRELGDDSGELGDVAEPKAEHPAHAFP